ncbi:mitochondrial assembly of ribosomal large subunit protein 1 [Hyperolius riggenbachi]|uniref:mitochondrial assembly of ribosomal large subunit protein 1 n=1 Tax=Hyperolius riggenbachi TaxID=752182 RepID=UPI0035A3A8A7
MWANRVTRLLVRRCMPRGSCTVNNEIQQLASAFAVLPQHRPQMASCGVSSVPGVMVGILQKIRSYSTSTEEPHTMHNGEPHQLPPLDPDSSWEEEEVEVERAKDLPEFNINVLVNLLRQENGKDLCVIRTPPEMKYAEYFVIVGAASTRHLQAMAQYTLQVYKYLKKRNQPHVLLEGRDTDDWMCVDFGNIVVHFMLPEARNTYELEKLWTLRSHDDQLSRMTPETLPADFMFGLHQKNDDTT